MADTKFIQKTNITIFHKYDPAEAEVAKQDLLRTYDDIEEIEQQRAAINHDYKQKLKSLSTLLKIKHDHLKRNGEDRHVECSLFLDFANEQRIFKNAKGEILLTLPFREEDYNRPVPLLDASDDFTDSLDDEGEVA